jgi:hypothetical protein
MIGLEVTRSMHSKDDHFSEGVSASALKLKGLSYEIDFKNVDKNKKWLVFGFFRGTSNF